MSNFYLEMDEVMREGRRAVLARIIKHAGSAPRSTGAKCLICEDGSIKGTIGGGLLEHQVTQRAMQIFKDEKSICLHFQLTNDEVGKQGIMLCGGIVDVYLELLPPRNNSDIEVFRKLRQIVIEKQSALLLTLIVKEDLQENISRHTLLTSDGSVVGSIDNVTDEQMQSLRSFPGIRNPKLKEIGTAGVVVFAEPLVPDDMLYIFGAGHISTSVVPVAKMAGFRVVVIDDRAEFLERNRFPLADELLTVPFSEAINRISVTPYSYLVIITRGHIHDLLVLRHALRTKPAYIGMIGSKRKKDMLYRALMDEGFTREELQQVHSPIGLDIGAETPEEIAISIVAELIRVRVVNREESLTSQDISERGRSEQHRSLQ